MKIAEKINLMNKLETLYEEIEELIDFVDTIEEDDDYGDDD